MKKGWVAMDKMGWWSWFEKKPKKSSLFDNEELNFWEEQQNGDIVELYLIFNIEPVEDWTKSLIEVGNDLGRIKRTFKRTQGD